MIKEEKFNQYGFPRNEEDILGITLHETGNNNMSARQLFDYLENECKTSQGTHYIVDDIETLQVMPNDWACYHTGKGLDWGNRFTIAIEICSSISDEKYQQAQDNAVALIKELMEEYAINKDSIFFHYDFNNRTHCPNRILNKYKNAKRFVIEEL